MKVEVAVLGSAPSVSNRRFPEITGKDNLTVFQSVSVSTGVAAGFVQCCFTPKETVWTIRDWEPLDVHLDFHAAPGL